MFPDADLKIFLTASIEERARRRANELCATGVPATEEDVARAIEERDRRDSEREVAPLRRAPDAVVVDTTATDVQGQVERILQAWKERGRASVRAEYRLYQWTIRTGARFLWGIRAEGVENIPRTGGIILAANHKSYLDPPLIGAFVPRQIHYLAKKQLLRVPLVGAWMRAQNVIPINREGFDRAGLEGALDAVRTGRRAPALPGGDPDPAARDGGAAGGGRAPRGPFGRPRGPRAPARDLGAGTKVVSPGGGQNPLRATGPLPSGPEGAGG